MPFIKNSSFKGNKLFRGSHLDTIAPPIFRHVPVNYVRKRIVLPDTDFIDLDWIQNGRKKLIVLFHGLEGSTKSQYMAGFSAYFSAKGFDICAVNFRTCSGQLNNLLRSYHSGATEDIDAVLNHINSKYKYETIILGGFSLGGNMLLKYLGEHQFTFPTSLKAAFAFSVPVDLKASSIKMESYKNLIYMHQFLKSLEQKMHAKSIQFPNEISVKHFDQIKTFTQFDNEYTAPMHGFVNADDYYKKCSALQFIHQIQLPTLLVNAQNDPFLTQSCFPKIESMNHPYFYFEMPKYGGHVGFANQFPNQSYWSEERIEYFISEYCN